MNTLQYHAHNVLELIHLHSGKYTEADIIDVINEHFGADARFYACSADNMDALQLMEFFHRKAKVKLADGKLQLNLDNVCNH